MATKLRYLVEKSIKNILCFDVKVASDENSTEIYIYNEDETIFRKESWEITITVLSNQLLFDFTFNNSAKRMQDLYLVNFSKVHKQFFDLIKNIENEGWTIKVVSNGLEVQNSPVDKENSFSVSAKKILSDSFLDKLDNIANQILLFTSIVLLPLVPDDVVETPHDEVQGMPEGALTKVLVNKYERNPKNRAICISYHGSICASCGFSFGDFYGNFAKDYIHVHHLTPVSTIGDNYVINPIRDLVPLCPNCHNAVHLENPPLSIQELKLRIGKK
jgi:predicted HNH restriction endonuclease